MQKTTRPSPEPHTNAFLHCMKQVLILWHTLQNYSFTFSKSLPTSPGKSFPSWHYLFPNWENSKQTIYKTPMIFVIRRFWIWDALLLGFFRLLGGGSGFAVYLSPSYFFVWVVWKRTNEDTKEHSPHYVPWHGSILKYHSKSVSNVNPMILWGRINRIFFFKSFKMNLVSLINHVINREI